MPAQEIEPGFGEERWPAVVAHRGASATHPENTLGSFEAAVEAGADVVEMDVRLTADGVPVISHDPGLAATTGHGRLVREVTLSELKRLDASVPTLREAMEVLSGRAGIDIENIPGQPDFDSPREAVAEDVVRQLDGSGFVGSVLVSSFNWLSIERVRELAPTIRTGFLTTDDVDPRAALAYAHEHGHAFVLPQAGALLEAGEGFVTEAHAERVRVGTWTVDDPATIGLLFSWGVDAVASNDPSTAVPVRDAARARRTAGSGEQIPPTG